MLRKEASRVDQLQTKRAALAATREALERDLAEARARQAGSGGAAAGRDAEADRDARDAVAEAAKRVRTLEESLGLRVESVRGDKGEGGAYGLGMEGTTRGRGRGGGTLRSVEGPL